MAKKKIGPFQIMIKPRGAICNLGCEYCYYLKKEALYPESNFFMDDQILESFTRQYIDANNVTEVTFAWQGGEPTLMGLDFYKRAIHYQNIYSRPGMRIFNTIQTNGTTLDDEWSKFFKENKFLVGLSLDGPRELHNTYRMDKIGKGSFDRVMEGLILLKKYEVKFNILTCVNAENVLHPIDVYRFLRDEIGTQFIQFIPIVKRDNKDGFQSGNKITNCSVDGKQYGEFLIKVFDEWIQKDVGKIFVQIFDVALGVWYGQPASLCIFSKVCGKALAMEHNGDLYSCDHFVEPKYLLGNILKSNLEQLISSNHQLEFGQNKLKKLPKYCRECDVRFICNGGCKKYRVSYTPDGEIGLNYLCEGYKAFFHHIDQPMRKMARLLHQRISPAEIMCTRT